MNSNPCGCINRQLMHKGRGNNIPALVFLSFFLTTAFVLNAQPPVGKEARQALLSVSYYIETANSSINSIRSLLRKDSYRNKITTLNNPANNELGFNLKNEILLALQPLLAKAKKTNSSKFRDVIENLISNPDENGLGTMQKYLPAAGVFSTVLSLVGNLVVNEKKITRKDLEDFISKTQQYFAQYEKLNAMNEDFGKKVAVLLEKSENAKQELKSFLIECISTLNGELEKETLEDMQVEVLLQKYFDPQKLQMQFGEDDLNDENLFPPDAATTVKFLTSGIKRLQKEFESVYFENYQSLKSLITSLKTTLPSIDENQLTKTSLEIDALYNDSHQADLINLNLALVEERMVNVCRMIHGR